MDDPGNKVLLAEIRDLLKDQNRLIAEIKAQNESNAARTAEHMASAESLARSQLAQNAEALGTIGSAKWLKWGVWIFMALLLSIFAVPMLWQFSTP